jgi:hypothetical protein
VKSKVYTFEDVPYRSNPLIEANFRLASVVPDTETDENTTEEPAEEQIPITGNSVAEPQAEEAMPEILLPPKRKTTRKVVPTKEAVSKPEKGEGKFASYCASRGPLSWMRIGGVKKFCDGKKAVESVAFKPKKKAETRRRMRFVSLVKKPERK